MRFKGMDLNLLVVLDALLTERGVTAAGARLHLSQSAVSCALARLREHLNDELLVTVGRKMIPTPFAEDLGPQVREILIQIDTALTMRSGYVPADSKRRFVVAASDYFVHVVLMEAQRRIHDEAPGVSIEVIPVRSSVFEQVQRAEIDLVVIPDTYPVEDCPGTVLLRDAFVCVAWDQNRLVDSTVTIEQFMELDHVVMQPEKGHVIAHDRWLQHHYNLSPSVKLCLPSFAFLPGAVIGTDRLATVPSRLADLCMATMPLKQVIPLFEMPSLVEMAYWHASRETDQGLAWLLRVMREVSDNRPVTAPA